MADVEVAKQSDFTIEVATQAQPLAIQLNVGTSVVIVGANGGGKTRLAVHIENRLGGSAHRISAHRALALNPGVTKTTLRQALASLRTGYAGGEGQFGLRGGHRWGGREAVSLLNDFDYLVQALFAEQTNRAHDTHRKARAGDTSRPLPTNFERLKEIWQRLLPHRELHVTGDDIQVSIPGAPDAYTAAEMSDGERAIFYMIGQALTAPEKSVLIIDEPELHVHRSVMARLWDEIEGARPDCALIYITHDLEFAALRPAQKFVIRSYSPVPQWDIEVVPPGTGFSEELTTLMLGGRRPVLFVEGTESSLDAAIFRACFPDWTIVPRGSCEEVIRSVVTMRRNRELTRITCAGIVDGDDYSASERSTLAEHGIGILPVSELENLFLLPTVSREILEHEGFGGEALDARLAGLAESVFRFARMPDHVDQVVRRHAWRRVDRALKRVDLGAVGSEEELAERLRVNVASVDVGAIAGTRRGQIESAIESADLSALLASYDNKGLLAVAATVFRQTHKATFEDWLTRILASDKAPNIVEAVRAQLPVVEPR